MMTESMEMCCTDKTLWEETQQVMKSERWMERQSCWVMNKGRRGDKRAGSMWRKMLGGGGGKRIPTSVCVDEYLSNEDTGNAFRVVSFRVGRSKQLLTFSLLKAVQEGWIQDVLEYLWNTHWNNFTDPKRTWGKMQPSLLQVCKDYSG